MRNYHTKLKRKVFERDHYTCQLNIHPDCKGDMTKAYAQYQKGQLTRKRASISVDHRVPLSRGGTWTLDNLLCACTPCNKKKGNKTEAELLELE